MSSCSCRSTRGSISSVTSLNSLSTINPCLSSFTDTALPYTASNGIRTVGSAHNESRTRSRGLRATCLWYRASNCFCKSHGDGHSSTWHKRTWEMLCSLQNVARPCRSFLGRNFSSKPCPATHYYRATAPTLLIYRLHAYNIQARHTHASHSQ
jgi:hypothetical protein